MSYLRLKQLTILWIAAIILGSFSPLEVKEAVGTETRSHAAAEVKRATNTHQVVHLFLFFVGGALLTAVCFTTRQRVASCLLLIALGFLIEWLQYAAFNGKHLETWDIRDDAIGAVLGFAVTQLSGFGARARQQKAAELAAK